MTGQKILLIEDDHDNSELVRFLLESVGHEILAAFDGTTGVKLALEEQPSLIILDIAIPELSGWEVAEKLKANSTTQNIPIVVLTAHTHPEDKRRAEELGVVEYLRSGIREPPQHPARTWRLPDRRAPHPGR